MIHAAAGFKPLVASPVVVWDLDALESYSTSPAMAAPDVHQAAELDAADAIITIGLATHHVRILATAVATTQESPAEVSAVAAREVVPVVAFPARLAELRDRLAELGAMSSRLVVSPNHLAASPTVVAAVEAEAYWDDVRPAASKCLDA